MRGGGGRNGRGSAVAVREAGAIGEAGLGTATRAWTQALLGRPGHARRRGLGRLGRCRYLGARSRQRRQLGLFVAGQGPPAMTATDDGLRRPRLALAHGRRRAAVVVAVDGRQDLVARAVASLLGPHQAFGQRGLAQHAQGTVSPPVDGRRRGQVSAPGGNDEGDRRRHDGKRKVPPQHRQLHIRLGPRPTYPKRSPKGRTPPSFVYCALSASICTNWPLIIDPGTPVGASGGLLTVLEISCAFPSLTSRVTIDPPPIMMVAL